MIHDVLLVSDDAYSESGSPAHGLQFRVGPEVGGDGITVFIDVVKNVETFSQTKRTNANADPEKRSDSGFNSNATMFAMDIDAVIDTLLMMKKHGAV